MSRVAGADESYMLAEEYFGLSAPIQYLWIYPSDPGLEALERLRDQLAAGALNRRVHRVRVPVARHRWVRTEHKPDVFVDSQTVDDAKVSDWADQRLRVATLAPITGNGWALDCAHTESGRLVVSLLVSHMVSDGQGLYNALAAAHAGTSTSTLPTADEASGRVGIRGDVIDAATQLREAVGATRVIVSELWRQRKKKSSGESGPKPVIDSSNEGPDTTLALLDLDKEAWTSTAREHGGTPNGLLIAILGGVVQRAGVPLHDDGMRICIAVNKRADGDDSANASGGVWIRVPDRIGPESGLAGIRKLSKQALIDYATSGNEKMTDNLQTIVRLLPKPVIGKMMRSVVGPDATVSNLGVAPATAIELGGVVAESFAIRAIMQGHKPADRRRQGPGIAAWAVEYGEKVTLAVFGIHPDHFGDTEQTRGYLEAELTEWGLSASRW